LSSIKSSEEVVEVVGGESFSRTIDADAVMKPYDPSKVKALPNDNIKGMTCYDIVGKKVAPENLYKVAEEADCRERNLQPIYNPGLDMATPGVTLSYVDLRKANLVKA